MALGLFQGQDSVDLEHEHVPLLKVCLARHVSEATESWHASPSQPYLRSEGRVWQTDFWDIVCSLCSLLIIPWAWLKNKWLAMKNKC